MYYINTDGKRYPKQIFNRLSEEEQSTFIEIDDETYDSLLVQCDEESKYMVVENGEVVLKDREIEVENPLVVEKRSLSTYLNDSNYIAINYGTCRSDEDRAAFLAETSSTYSKTNEEVLDERDEAIARINEINILLNN